MSKSHKRTTPIRHLFVDTHQLTPAQREHLAKRLKRFLDLEYCTEAERPGDGTATLFVKWEMESIEREEARVWRLIERVYRPRLLHDGEIDRLRSIHDVLPPPDTSREVARREEYRQRTGLRFISVLPANAVDVYPLGPDCLSGDDFNSDSGEPPLMKADDLDRQVADYYPGHETQAKEFMHTLDALLRRHLRLFMSETGPRWRKRSFSGDVACAAFRYLRDVTADAVCHTTHAG